MSFKRTASAIVSRAGIEFDEWVEELRGQNEGAVPKDYAHRIAKTVLRKCNPDQYLLSHATIVASVDTFAPKSVKTGRQMNRGVQVDVRWPDFRIKPECTEIINNNGDAWERSLLLSTYRTFIGAHNYLEHVQIPELSKGFIVDAVARDLGNSCYIDILVATDKKHKQLVSDILSGGLSGLSMGCISLFTVCSKCGNVASDDSQLCPCIQYEGKHTEYTGEDGNKYKISELIGHVSVPNSNQFIEASWVKNPAFRGAVRRNFLNANNPHVAGKIEAAAEINSGYVPSIIGIAKAASSFRYADQDQDAGQGQGQGAGTPGLGDTAEPADSPDKAMSSPVKSDKLDELLDKAQEHLMSLLVEKLGERLQPKAEDVATIAPVDLEASNASLVRSSTEFSKKVRLVFASSPKLIQWAERAYKIVHEGGVHAIRKASLTSQDLIVLSWIEDVVKGRIYPSPLYKLAMKTGSITKYPSETSFIASCSLNAGRQLTASEKQFLTWKGRIASLSG